MGKVSPQLIAKLLEEAKALKPIVKKGAQEAGMLAKEGQLASGQKIIQKLTPAEEYAQKMKFLSQERVPRAQRLKMAAGAGAIPMGGSPQEMLGKPATQLADLYEEYVNQPLEKLSQKIASPIVEKTNLERQVLMSPERQKEMLEREAALKQLVGSGVNLAIDPTTYMGGVGAAVPLGASMLATPKKETSNDAEQGMLTDQDVLRQTENGTLTDEDINRLKLK